MSSTEAPSGKYYKRSNFNLNAILPPYVIILVVCMLGNLLVLLTIIKNKNMRTRCYSLLANLALADMGFALFTPVHLLQFAKVNLGTIGCKLSIYGLDIFYGTALLTLAYISIERYYGICYPSLLGNERRVKVRWIIPLIWLAAGFIYAPMLCACKQSRNQSEIRCDCHSVWPSGIYYTIYALFIVTATYIVPFLAMLYCYFRIYKKLWTNSPSTANFALPASAIKPKKKVVKLLVISTVLFFIAWTPYNTLYILKKLHLVSGKLLGKLWLFSQVLGFLNSAFNPFIYGIFSKQFRNGCKEALFGVRKPRSSTIESNLATIHGGKGQSKGQTQSTSTTIESNLATIHGGKGQSKGQTQSTFTTGSNGFTARQKRETLV